MAEVVGGASGIDLVEVAGQAGVRMIRRKWLWNMPQ